MARDRFKDYTDRSMHRIKKHNSILRPIVYLIIFLFFVTVILDPYTNSIEETDIIISIGSYPYEKIKVAIWGEIEDEDNDGLSDDDELDGLKIISDYISLPDNDYVTYRFNLEQEGNYILNIHYRSDIEASMDILLTDDSGDSTYQKSFTTSSSWDVKTLIPGKDLESGNVELKITCTNGEFDLDSIMLKTIDNTAGVSQDSDDFFETNAQLSTMFTNDSEIIVYTDPGNKDSDFDGILDGYEYLAAKNGGWQNPMITNNRYAFIMASGSHVPDENFNAFWNTAEAVYNTMHDYYGYESRNIKLLFWDGEGNNPDMVDGSTEKADINSTLNSLENSVGRNDFVFFYITGHGFYDGPKSGYSTEDAMNSGIAIFDPDNVGTKNDHITYEELEGYTSRIAKKVSRMTIVIEACYSGRGLEVFPLPDSPEKLVFIASSDGEKVSFGQRDSFGIFGFHALKALEHPALANVPTYKEIVNIDLSFDRDKFMISMKELFDYVNDKITLPPNSQFPQITGDGDFISDDGDEGVASNTYL